MMQNTALSAYSPELDALVAKLKKTSDKDDRTLLIEHLETANSYLHGVMPDECKMNLDMARESATTITEADLKRETNDLIDRLERRLNA